MIKSSSRFLVHKLISEIDFSKDMTIVQLWSGRAVFQKQILPKMSPNSHLYTFEIDKKWHKYSYEISDNRYIYIVDSAENMEKYIQNADVIISTLPFGSLPKCLLTSIITAAEKTLKKWWIFLQYQYFLQNKKDIEKIFNKKAKIRFEARNLPPAFVYKIIK